MWRAITEADFLEGLSTAESDAWRTHASVSNEGDPLPGIMTSVTAQIREAVRSYKENKLHPDATFVPDGCIFYAVPLIRHRLLTKIDETINDARMKEYTDAQTYLRDVRAGKVFIEPPADNPEKPAQAPSPKPMIKARKKHFGRDQQDGI